MVDCTSTRCHLIVNKIYIFRSEPNTETQKKTNFFEDVEDSSTSESENEQPSINKGDNSNSLPNPLADKLPSPGLSDIEKSGSVFCNPFVIAEQAKNSILEKHVKMTETKTELTGKKTKKSVCFKFKKGKCHFGKNCKYSHDIESSIAVKPLDNNIVETFPSQAPRGVSDSYFGLGSSFGQPLPPEPEDDSYMSNAKKKKRSGMSEHLVPPKKAMRALDAQREKERPWTVNK